MKVLLSQYGKKRQRVVCPEEEHEDEVKKKSQLCCLQRPAGHSAQASLPDLLRSRIAIPSGINSGDYVDVVPWSRVPECAWLDGCTRIISNGPRHERFRRELGRQFFLRDDESLRFVLVVRENDESRTQLARFRKYINSLPEAHRQVWKMWHGIRGDNGDYDTNTSRIDQLDPSRVSPNAHRAHDEKNRLGDGIYFSSHLSYNVLGGFYEVASDTGAVKLLQCLVAPGRYLHLGLGGAPDMVHPPPYFHSRVAQGFSNSGVVISCIHDSQAIYVEHEIHIYGIQSTSSNVIKPLRNGAFGEFKSCFGSPGNITAAAGKVCGESTGEIPNNERIRKNESSSRRPKLKRSASYLMD